jgi:rhodanese-related sulfurtransferase
MGSDGGATLMAWEGNFAIWVGTLVSPNTRLVVVTSKGQETEAIQRLARVGYKAEIVLDGGVEAWEEEQLPTEKTDRMKVKSEEQLTCLTQEDDNIIIDVRTVSEYATNHVTTAMNIPLSDLMQARHDLDKSKQYLLYCRSGYRSFIGVSVLKSIGLQATDFVGGFAALNVHAPQSTVTGEVCPNLRKTLEDFEAAERATA